MKTFEFQNILPTDDFPKVLDISHIPVFKNQNALKKINRALKQHFWTEVQQVGSEPTVVWTYVEHIYTNEWLCVRWRRECMSLLLCMPT